MLFSERRYDYYSACGPIFGVMSKLSLMPKGLGANHPKYRTTPQFRSRLSAYRLSEKNASSCADEVYAVLLFKFGVVNSYSGMTIKVVLKISDHV